MHILFFQTLVKIELIPNKFIELWDPDVFVALIKPVLDPVVESDHVLDRPRIFHRFAELLF